MATSILSLTLLLAITPPAHAARGTTRTAPVRVAQTWRGYPTQPPPPPVRERVEHRRGQVWVPGYHEWRGGQYVWVGGHFEAERPGWHYAPGRWDWQADHYVWVPGTWIEERPGVNVYVGNAPPPPPAPVREVAPARRPGWIWVPGAHEWRDGRYVWVGGHWEPERRGHHWNPGHWEREGPRHVWRPGGWRPER